MELIDSLPLSYLGSANYVACLACDQIVAGTGPIRIALLTNLASWLGGWDSHSLCMISLGFLTWKLDPKSGHPNGKGETSESCLRSYSVTFFIFC